MQPRAIKYDAIIALANLMDKDGNLNNESQSRMDKAIDFFKAGVAKYIITIGWDYRDDSDLPVAYAMRDYAVKKRGISSESILCDINSRDTVGDAIFSKRNIMLPKSWNNLLVVTSDYHVNRTKEIFSFIYGNSYNITVEGAVSRTFDNVEKSEAKSLQAFNNTFSGILAGDDIKIFERLNNNHPFYNGDIYPKFNNYVEN